MRLFWICSVLPFLAHQALGTECEALAGQPSASPMVNDTTTAEELAEAVSYGGSFAVEWVGIVTIKSLIIVNENTTLCIKGAGDGSSGINGANHQPLFEVNNGNLHISGLNLLRGNYSLGGAIRANGSNISVDNCSFIENTAKFGGGIYAYSSTVIVDNTNFFGNLAGKSGDLFYDSDRTDFNGGAIYGYKTSVSATDCLFFGNIASFGGTIYVLSSNLVLANVNIFGNISGYSENTIYDARAVDFYGGAIFADDSNVSVDNCSIVESIASFGGAIYVMLSTVVLDNVSFLRNGGEGSENIYNADRTDFEGGAIFADRSNVSVDNCLFVENIASFGGTIFLISSILILDNAYFANNLAENAGGAIYGKSGASIVVYGGAVWEANQALYGGAIFLLDARSFEILGSAKFINNSASEGGGVILSGGFVDFSRAEFISNFARSSGGAIRALSSGTQDDHTTISLCTFENNTAGDAGGAIFIAGGFVDVGDSNFTGNIAGRTGGAILASGITSLTYTMLENNRAYTGPAVSNTVSISISWTEFVDNNLLCINGYFLDSTTNVSAYSTACYDCHAEEECANCTVQNKAEVQVCKPVLPHTTNPRADGTIESLELHKGFWRSSPISKDVRECYEEKACIGGTNNYCAAGYTGPFCAVCMDGYARGLGYLCTECSEERQGIMLAVAVVIFVLLGVVIVVGIRSLISNTEMATFPPLRMLKMIISRLRRTRVHQSLKIMVISWQIITQFSEVASVAYPKMYDDFLEYIDVFNLNLGWVLSAGCLVNTDFVFDLLVCTIGPLTVTFLVLVSYKMTRRRCPVEDEGARIRLYNKHGAILFWVSVVVYSTASSIIFQSFACDDLDTGKSYLRADHSLECYTVKHKTIMAYAGIMSFVYPFGIPFCYSLLLYRNRATLRSVESREAASSITVFRDLWQPYKPDMFWYEVFECLRRVILSGIVVFIFPNTAGQVATTFLFAFAFFVAMLIFNPYMNKWDTWLARIAHVIVNMSMFVALLQKADISEDDRFSQDVFAGVLVVAHCVMILAVIAEACGLYFLAFQDVNPPVYPTIQGVAPHVKPSTHQREGFTNHDVSEEKCAVSELPTCSVCAKPAQA